jgi:hypothetical protein|nr:hypothetical protein [Kofleriaceae bacterium]
MPRKQPAEPAPAPDPLRARAMAGDLEALEVHADALLEAGDPRGELIRLQLELAKRPDGDPARMELELAISLLFIRHGERFTAESSLDSSHAQCRVSYGYGYPYRIELAGVRWNQIATIARKLGDRAASAQELELTGKLDWARIPALLDALPRVHVLDLSSSLPRIWIGDASAALATPAGDRIDELRFHLHDREQDQLAKLVTAPLRGLRTLDVTAQFASDYASIAASAAAPAITSWKLQAGHGLSPADARVMLSATGRRTEPLRDVDLWSHALDETTADMIADLPARYRSVRLRCRTPASAIAKLLANDRTRELEAFETRVAPSDPPAVVDTPIVDLELGGLAAELAVLAAAIRAPRLRRLTLDASSTASDGLAAVFDSPWLDTVEHLRVRPAEPWLAAVTRTTARASRLDVMTTSTLPPSAVELIGWSGLSNVRVFVTGTALSAEALHRLLSNPALDSLVTAEVKIAPGALAELASWPVPRELRYLSLDGTLSQRDVETLARWPGARQLVTLSLGFQFELSVDAAKLIADPARFPRLRRFGCIWDRRVRSQVEAIVDARFGAGDRMRSDVEA